MGTTLVARQQIRGRRGGNSSTHTQGAGAEGEAGHALANDKEAVTQTLRYPTSAKTYSC
jgi:hypothetical protein